MRRTIVLVAIGLACLALFVGVGTAAHEEPGRNILAFELDTDGNATVYHVQAHDFNDTQERERYESLADNETRQAAHREEILTELAGAAADGRNATELEMRVHNGSVRTYERDGYGHLEVRAEWSNLGFWNDERVVVTEPFRGGYEPDLSRIGIHAPDGYVRGTTQPEPIRVQRNSALWSPRVANLSGFYAEFEDPDAGGTDTGSGGDGSGTGGDGNGDSQNGGDGNGGDIDGQTLLVALGVALVPVALALLVRRRA